MIKKYYKIQFKLLEPLSLGAGTNKHSDRDILKDGNGDPFIPGTSLCGVYRSLFDPKQARTYFGDVEIATKQTKRELTTMPSRVKVYDATVIGAYKTSIRDSVGLDAYKTAKKGAKFDFELVEPGAVFVTYLEQDMLTDIWGNADLKEEDIGREVAARLYAGELYLGHKSMRGYGRIKAEAVWHKSFVLPDKGTDAFSAEQQAWIAFDMYDEDAFAESDKLAETDFISQDVIHVELDLQLQGGISIRQYTTALPIVGKNAPDYTQMYYVQEGNKEVPYIPGTSWAGAFRHHMGKLMPRNANVISLYFDGTTDRAAGLCKSKVRFAESFLTGAESKTMTRTALDRFTGGVVDGALYTEKAFFGGSTTLRISFPKDTEQKDLWSSVMAAAISDLHQGFLAVGGLTSVGRGVFRVTTCKCNGKTIPIDSEETFYERLLEAFKGEAEVSKCK